MISGNLEEHKHKSKVVVLTFTDVRAFFDKDESSFAVGAGRLDAIRNLRRQFEHVEIECVSIRCDTNGPCRCHSLSVNMTNCSHLGYQAA